MVYLSKENIDSELWTSFDISDDFIVSHCAYFINKNGNELQSLYLVDSVDVRNAEIIENVICRIYRQLPSRIVYLEEK